MKLYTKPTRKLLRVQIKQKGAPKVESVAIENATVQQFLEYAKRLIAAQKLPFFAEGKTTLIQVREISGTNGKSKSLSFKGLNPEQTKKIIVEDLTDEKAQKN